MYLQFPSKFNKANLHKTHFLEELLIWDAALLKSSAPALLEDNTWYTQRPDFPRRAEHWKISTVGKKKKKNKGLQDKQVFSCDAPWKVTP